MNNELTPLEALNNIRKLVNDVQYASKIPSIDNELDIIENSIKYYDELTNKSITLYGRTHGKMQATIDIICKNYKEVKIINLEDEKKLKALEIIKEKEVNIQTFKKWIIDRDWSYEDYLTEIGDINVLDYFFSKIPLTKEEFDILKEVLK